MEQGWSCFYTLSPIQILDQPFFLSDTKHQPKLRCPFSSLWKLDPLVRGFLLDRPAGKAKTLNFFINRVLLIVKKKKINKNKNSPTQ